MTVGYRMGSLFRLRRAVGVAMWRVCTIWTIFVRPMCIRADVRVETTKKKQFNFADVRRAYVK